MLTTLALAVGLLATGSDLSDVLLPIETMRIRQALERISPRQLDDSPSTWVPPPPEPERCIKPKPRIVGGHGLSYAELTQPSLKQHRRLLGEWHLCLERRRKAGL